MKLNGKISRIIFYLVFLKTPVKTNSNIVMSNCGTKLGIDSKKKSFNYFEREFKLKILDGY